jgi:hypothetical protein
MRKERVEINADIEHTETMTHPIANRIAMPPGASSFSLMSCVCEVKSAV